IQSDPNRLRQILLNLLGNAIKFTETGSIGISVDLVHGNVLRFAISDTGIGIGAESIRHLFQPFTQGDSSTTRRFGGSGLGLAISQRLAEMLGGNIQVESQPGIGSTFTLQIPVGVRTANKSTDPALTSGSTTHGLQGMRILLVEDDQDIRRIVRKYLERAGTRVDELTNGQEALERLSGSDSYDCVLMDIQMPVMDGRTAVRELRKRGYDGHIVAMTAHALSSEVASILDAGFQAYLAKPIDKGRLYQIIAEAARGSNSQG
ncbi:MAG: response regulator, partial [Leptospiraceae bacterium]|nr:response regulator [Leptospiraceae bacterium]